ncbi:MAG: gliding motility-associated C-terminal domain-containing protein [Bacteroidetes bacterium]|nr:gliding motility-associated C-terminal domain-containing protein [Bacteroidota bacterium]
MRKSLRASLLTAICLMATVPVRAGDGFYGTRFWVTWMENSFAPADVQLIIAPTTQDTVVLYHPQTNTTLMNGTQAYWVVYPGQYNKISIKPSYAYSVLGPVAQGTGLRVSSRRDISVYALNAIPGSADMTAVLPDHLLKNARDYYVTGYGGQKTGEAQVAVLAMDTGNTTIEISLKADLFTGQGNGSVFTRNLKQGQVFLMQALEDQNLSGSRIRVKGSCKRIAVFSGARCAKVRNVGACVSCDVLYEQVWPAEYAGKQFLVPGPALSNTYQLAVTALYNGTTVTINGGSPLVMNSGDRYNTEIKSAGYTTVIADKPLFCASVLNSAGCNGGSTGHGDPSLFNIAPLDFEAKTRDATVQAYKGSGYFNYLVVLTETKAQPQLKLNGAPLTAPVNYIKNTLGSRTIWGAYIKLPNTVNTFRLQSDTGFNLYCLGFAQGESYAYCASADLSSHKASFDIAPVPVCDPVSPVQFTARGDSLGQVSWYFGDGNNANGISAQHTYGKTGVWAVRMVNQNPGQACAADTVQRSLRILQGPRSGLPSDTQPCKGRIYRIQLPQNGAVKYKWENGSTSFQQNIQTDRVAVVTMSDTQGCVRTDSVRVKFKNCDLNSLKLANVFTPGNDGLNDNWIVLYEGYEQVHVKIYSRWGVLVADYHLPDDEDWNGNVMNGSLTCPDGTYFYRIEARDDDTGDVKAVSGSINLIR